MNTKPVISILHDTRRALTKKNVLTPIRKDEIFPVKLRATFQAMRGDKKVWLQKYYLLRVACTVNDWRVAMTAQPRTQLQREIREAVVAAEEKANVILKSNRTVTPNLFDLLFGGAGSLQTVEGIFNIMIEELEKADRIGSAKFYKNTRNAVKKYAPELRFGEISPAWLQEFGGQVTCGPTTLAIYMRTLRAVCNRAMVMQLVTPDWYPFGIGKYVIRETESRKIALTRAEKEAVEAYANPEHRYAVDMFLFSYYSYGLNMADIFTLRFGDIIDGIIWKRREKTKRSKNQALKIPLHPEAAKIIARHGNRSLNPGDYVFPVYTEGMDEKQKAHKRGRELGKINKGLKAVQADLKLRHPLTTYTARHTFANLVLQNNVVLQNSTKMAFLRESLGHAEEKMTKVYTEGFETSTKQAVSAQL